MHLASGYSYLATGDFRLEPQNPPLLKQYLALPLFLIQRLPFRTDTQHWRGGTSFLMAELLRQGGTIAYKPYNGQSVVPLQYIWSLKNV